MTFKLDRVPHLVIEDIWISKVVRWVTINTRISLGQKLKRAVIAYGFANWTVLALEEVLVSMYPNSEIFFRFNGKTQWQLYKFRWNSFPINVWMKNRKDLNLGEGRLSTILLSYTWFLTYGTLKYGDVHDADQSPISWWDRIPFRKYIYMKVM